ncbi:MAG: SGNH/GDSL hydrolase family protein, partial [bacterium]
MIGHSDPSFHAADATLGWVQRPLLKARFRREGDAHIEFNSAGFRDRERALEKPHDTFRIAVLGDSYTVAFQVPVENTFCSVMEDELQKCANLKPQRVEVLNFGVSGYNTVQELILFRQCVKSYRPDMVLVAFFAGNDVYTNSLRFGGDPMRPYATIRGGTLVLDNSFTNSGQYRFSTSRCGLVISSLLNHSSVLQVAKAGVCAINRRMQLSKHRRIANEGLPEGSEPLLYNEVYSEPSAEEWREAWDITERLLVEMRDEIARCGAQCVVVTITTGIQVHPDPSVRKNFEHYYGISDLFYPDARIRALGEREHFPVLNLAQPLQHHAEKTGVYFHGLPGFKSGEGHWNAVGHALAGKIIAESICELLGRRPAAE